MTQLTLSAIAKLYGMHRTTLYAAVKAKRVSVGSNLKGQKVIDLAEAIRVWGEPIHHPERSFDSSTGSSTLNSTPTVDLAEIIAQAVAKAVYEAVEPLRLEIQQLRLENAEQRLIGHDKAPETKADDYYSDIFESLKAKH